MSKRNRHTRRSKPEPHIEWLKSRTGYPSLEEREKIIELRQELSFELIQRAVMGVKPDDASIQSLIRKYGVEEVERATRTIGSSMDRPSLVADDARVYRDYRLRYARFGEGLKFYSAREVDELYENNMRQLADSLLKRAGGTLPRPENDINRLLLIGWNDWKDLTPPALPRAPLISRRPSLPPTRRPSKNFLNGGTIFVDHTTSSMKMNTSIGGSMSLP